MKRWKKALSCVLALCMLVCLLPVTILAENVSISSTDSLKDVIENAVAGDVITLTADVTLSENVTLPYGVTLDMGTYSITGSEHIKNEGVIVQTNTDGSKTVSYCTNADVDKKATLAVNPVSYTIAAPDAENYVTIDCLTDESGAPIHYAGLMDAYHALRQKWEVNLGVGKNGVTPRVGGNYNHDKIGANQSLTWTVYGEAVHDTAFPAEQNILTGGYVYQDGGVDFGDIVLQGGNESAKITADYNPTYPHSEDYALSAGSTVDSLTIRNLTLDAPTFVSKITNPNGILTIQDCTITGRLHSPNGKGTCIVKGCTFNNEQQLGEGGYACMIQGPYAQVIIDQNKIENYARGLNVQVANADVTISNNNIQTDHPTRGSIQLTSAKSVDVSGNTVENKTGAMFWFYPNYGCNDTSITGNTFIGPYLFQVGDANNKPEALPVTFTGNDISRVDDWYNSPIKDQEGTTPWEHKILIDTTQNTTVPTTKFPTPVIGSLLPVLGSQLQSPFVDVTPVDYYYDAVNWAVDKDITTGTGRYSFSPDEACTRAQAVTFLWRAAGSPAPKNAVTPFVDVDSGAYYAKAVAWAVENGITNGTSATTFSPDETCTRAQIVTFLYRAFGKSVDASTPFADVAADAYYAPAVAWAAASGVTGGTGSGKFSPAATCTRAQIVTFLYRCCG